jgi:hypothetical protein
VRAINLDTQLPLIYSFSCKARQGPIINLLGIPDMKTIILLVGCALTLAATHVSAGYLPIENTNAPLPATGCALVSVWVRPTTPAMHDKMVHLVVREAKGKKGKTKDRLVNSTRLATGHWSRVSAWLYPKVKKEGSRLELLLSVADTAAVEIAYANVQLPGQPKPAFDQGFVRVDGRLLINNDGPLVLRGVNITAYSDDKKDDPGKILAMITPRDYAQIAEQGFNAVRLTCWFDALQKAGGWDWLDTQIAMARHNGLYIVLDMHAPPGGYQGPQYRGSFWRSKKKQEQLLEWWREVAQRYKNEPVIAAYDLINEPLPQYPAQWYAYAQQLVDAIRAEGDTHTIVVETDIDSGELWTRINDAAIIYDFHWYDPWEYVAQSESKPFGAYGEQHFIWGELVVLNKEWLRAAMDEYVQWCANNNVPMQVGEYGIGRYALQDSRGGLQWLQDTCDLLADVPASRFYWSWYPFDFGLNYGWYRRDPGDFNSDVAEIAASE